MRSALLGAILGATALTSLAHAQMQPQVTPNTAPEGQAEAQAGIAECDRLINYLEHQRSDQTGVTVDQARAWRRALEPQLCREHLDRLTKVPDAASAITTSGVDATPPNSPPAPVANAQPSPSPPEAVHTPPSAGSSTPQVVVQQSQPSVTVRQGLPEIIVRQAPPIITVEQPQPEIIVRMPEPDVNVAMTQPQVEVRIPQPRVEVVPPQTGQNVAKVELDRQQPQVRFERTGEPQIIYQPAEGQPRIRFEGPGSSSAEADRTAPPQEPQQQAAATPHSQTSGAETAAQQSIAASPNPQSQSPSSLSPRGAQAMLNDGSRAPDAAGATKPSVGNQAVVDPAQTGALPGVVQQALKVSELEDRRLHDARGESVGEIQNVVSGPEQRLYLIVSHGGFLGLGAKEIAVPVDQVALRGDRLTLEGITEEALRAMPAFDEAGFRDLDDGETAVVRVLR